VHLFALRIHIRHNMAILSLNCDRTVYVPSLRLRLYALRYTQYFDFMYILYSRTTCCIGMSRSRSWLQSNGVWGVASQEHCHYHYKGL
jgi:hypothetical protein